MIPTTVYGVRVEFDNEADALELFSYLSEDMFLTAGFDIKHEGDKWYVSQYVKLIDGAEIVINDELPLIKGK